MWANSPWDDAYRAISQQRIGPAALHLDLSLATWAADGLLAVFFFVAGLELNASSSPVNCEIRAGPRCRADRDADGIPDVYEQESHRP